MSAIVAYVRQLINNFYEPVVRPSFNKKRDRNDDDISSDEDSQKFKRLKKTTFPKTMATRDLWEKEDSPKVRYVPIQIDKGHPSTSTPYEQPTRLTDRCRTLPMKLVDASDTRPSTPIRTARRHTHCRPLLVLDDEDNEVTLIESEPRTSNRTPKTYINLSDDNEQEDDDDDDVIFVKKVIPPPKSYKYKYFVSKNNGIANEPKEEDSVTYYKVCKKLNERNFSNSSPKSYTKFKSHKGITKTYRKTPTPIPKWLQGSTKANSKNTLTEVFNLDEKKNYQELIKRVTDSMKPREKIDIFNLADESATFRNTQRAQKSALNEIKRVENGLSASNETTNEYDPITVASINSSDSEVEIVSSEASYSSSVRIGQINTLRDSHKDKDVTSDDWLTKLNTRYKIMNLDNQKKVKNAARQSEIISKVNQQQNVALLEHKLKYELSIPESLIEELPPTPELPKLSAEQSKLVDKILGPGAPGQLVIEKFNLRIHRRDMQTLAGLNWLNDEVINFYMNLLMQRCEERPELPRVYATNTFFYPKLMQAGQAGLRRWTRKVDIFAHDLMIVPVHLGVHWCLSIVDFRERRVAYLDSMGGRNQPCLDALLQYLRDEHKDKKGRPFDDSGWTTENLKDIPQQMNGSDCGMFACTFAEFSARAARYTFTQAHMPALRRKAVYEIATGKLLL